MAQQRLHKMRANTFYNLLKEEKEEMVTFSFDCQKNLALPKLPDQLAYFSMQINFYHLSIVCGSSNSKLNPGNVNSYVWTELDHKRSSSEISSALNHSLAKYDFTENVKIVRLICDGCGAQNKNSTVIAMLSYWLQFQAPHQIEKIELIFPVVGHSYIPPDRVFGQIEKAVKKQREVVHPEEYITMIKKFGTVYRLGKDLAVLDWKNECQNVLRQTGNWHFKFQPSKRILIVRSRKTDSPLVRGEVFYRNDVCISKGLCKRGKHIRQMNPKEVAVGVPINKDKKESVSKLLEKHYGYDWKNEHSLKFFVEAFNNLETGQLLPEEEGNCEEESIEFGI